MTGARRCLLLCAALGFVCCGPAASAEDASVDAQARDAGGAPLDAAAATLELGTGDPGIFRSVTDGQQVLLQRGCQGAQHIFFALRGEGFSITEAPRLELSVVREEDGAVVSSPYSLRLAPMVVRDGVAEWTGLTPVIEEPRLVVGRSARMRATIEDASRTVRVTVERRVSVVWGPDSCRPHG
ncbi:MAG: hypothetical protein JNK05_03200 [Myxococcales bacterium]|nr:hypothetical protein [Myxococcales bacterium]